MDTTIHALIRGFLQQQTVTPLLASSPQPVEHYTKAGVVPFMRRAPEESGGQEADPAMSAPHGASRKRTPEEFVYYVMKPESRIPGLGAPPFQLCKGTRQHLLPGLGWRDIKLPGSTAAEDRESLAETALRESIEELGLQLRNIVRLFDLGGFTFSSATTGKEKHMWLFASEMADADDFLSDRDLAPTTQQRAWLTAAEFSNEGRTDHRYIVNVIEQRLKEHLGG